MFRGLMGSCTVSDESVAEAWYSRLLDRGPDSRPMPGLLEWHLGGGFGLQVWAEPDRAGHSSVVIEVDDLDSVVGRLVAAGVDNHGPQPGGGRRILVVEDPDGNRVVFAGADRVHDAGPCAWSEESDSSGPFRRASPRGYASRMGIFLGILNGAADPATEPELTEAEQAEFMAAWSRWAEEAGPALADPGRPLYRKRRVTSQGVEVFEDARVAYMLLSAPSHESAVDIVRGHPFLALFPGNSIDVIECPDVP